METYVALLRGINVGGRNSLPMKELATLLAALGCREVRTYIQSGNVVLLSDKAPAKLSAEIGAKIQTSRGFEPHVLLLTASDFRQAVDNNPFSIQEGDAKSLHLGFLDGVPVDPDLQGLESLKTPTERFQLIDRVFYLLAPDGVGRSKLAARSERLLGCPMTSRNWNTVGKILSMVEATAAR